MPATPWEQIDYSPAPPVGFALPEHHWSTLQQAPLTEAQRVRANHEAACFSCEMFIQCERYVIDYFNAYRRRFRGAASDAALDHFVHEERVHIDAFFRLLTCLKPERYPQPSLRLMKWTVWDRLMLFIAPGVSLFLIAALFEEMSLFVPDVLDEQPAQTFAPVRAVMAEHRREELAHLSLDHRALGKLSKTMPRWLFAAQALFSLPLMAYVDWMLGRAWRRMMSEFARAEGLSGAARRALLRRRPSRSDVMGIESFIAKLKANPIPGGKALCWLLAKTAL